MRLGASRGWRVVMLLENDRYPQDIRVRDEAESLVRAGYRVSCLAPRSAGQRRRETVAGVQVSRYWLPRADGSRTSLVLEYVVAHVQLFIRGAGALLGGADVVHLHNPPDTLFPVAWLARRLGRRAVFDMHDLAPALYREKFGSSRIVRLLETAQCLACRAADATIATNVSQQEIVRTHAGVPADRVTVVRNGPSAAKLDEARPPRRDLAGRPRLLFLGELEVQDGALVLPDLLVRPGFEGAELTVVGDGPDRERIEAKAGRLGVIDRVRFTGWVPHDTVFELLADADICLDPAPPSRFSDLSTMTKIAEYLAAGRPVVAFDLCETRRTAADCALYAGDGSLDEFADHIRRLINDPDIRLELADRAHRRAAELTWEHSERALLAVYAALAPLAKSSVPVRHVRARAAVLAWNSERKRADELGAALGGDGRTYYDLELLSTPLIPVRYAISTIRMIAYLARRRPRALVVQSPPVIPPLIGYLYARLAGVPFVLDSHPSSFGVSARRIVRLQIPLLAWLARRAAGVMVCDEPLAEIVRDWGGVPVTFFEAPPDWSVPEAPALGTRPRVLLINTFASDEPIAAAVEAARLLPDIDWQITGDLRKRPPALAEQVTDNVTFTGYLLGDDYTRALTEANVILCLTTKAVTASRAAFETIHARRPLISSDYPLARDVFPYATFVQNDATSIAAGIEAAIGDYDALVGLADKARTEQNARFRAQFDVLSRLLDLDREGRVRDTLPARGPPDARIESEPVGSSA